MKLVNVFLQAVEVKSVLGNSGTSIKGKSKKDINGDDFDTQEFYVYIYQSQNKVNVYYGKNTSGDSYMVSPNVSKLFAE